ncbi:MAG: serine--tRNA ligase [Verrucomicrobia bacterium]|jgi:seryl-tRNA synthetase|nr:serine--tRNA ligase [Verrucomicrobiota bacterium]MBT7066800.1 serine--tRNA ligase [Verrucomicrobiota bacterium]MBT7701459.1 serine--tRNA ligase [Verrucomicrobiota bacterium]
MLDIRSIREDAEAVRNRLATKGVDPGLIDKVVASDAQRRTLLTEVEEHKGERNRVSKQIGALKREGKDTSEIQAQTRELGEKIGALDVRLREVEAGLNDTLLGLPNMPHASAPVGADASANLSVREHGTLPSFDFEPKAHMALGESLGLLDMPRAARMSGAGFALFTGAGARLQRALINFMLDMHVSEHGYREIWPPSVCNSASMTGTGQLPKMVEDMYGVNDADLWLIPTAEVPVTNFYREEIIQAPLPICLTAYTPCFRKEAGAAGKETRGLIRLHQFDKVEMVKFVEPATSYDELEALVANAEDVLQRLELPYRVIELCTGDLSFAAAKCYDIELWAPGQNAWLEVSSCSNFEDFQARRAGIRYRDGDGKPRHVHTLNGSGVALPRLVVAILENGQQADGSVVLPEALVPYMNGMATLEAEG